MSLSLEVSPTEQVEAEPERKLSRQDKAAATRATLLRVARALFAEQGYFEIGTPELVAAMGMTRGALYHNFRNKRDLFEAVFIDTANELVTEAIAKLPADLPDVRTRLREGASSYLAAVAASPDRQRILLIDGPVVLGWEHWRLLESTGWRERLEVHIGSLMADGTLPQVSVERVGQLLLATYHEGALAIAHAPEGERDKVRLEMEASLHVLIDALASPRTS